MADENDLERTEPASPRRREEARAQGQVPQSRELATLVVVASSGAALWLAGAPLVSSIGATLEHGLVLERELAFDPQLLLSRLSQLVAEAFLALLPFIVVALVAAFLGPLVLRGWVFSPKALAPDLARLDPVKGFGRMFSLSSLMELAVSVAKALLVGGAGAWALWSQRETLAGLAFQTPATAFVSLGAVLALSFLWLVGAVALVALIDVPFQLWHHGRRLRMSREEVKRELKETEGDPQIKARIREVAERHGVPVLSAPPLARALYHHAELGEEIPEILYAAVAEVLAYVYQLRHARALGQPLPPPLDEVAVPPGLDPGPSAVHDDMTG